MTTLQRLLFSRFGWAFYPPPCPWRLACRHGAGAGVNRRPAIRSSEVCHCVVRKVANGDAVIIAGHVVQFLKALGTGRRVPSRRFHTS